MSAIYLAARFSKRFAMQGHRAVPQRIGHFVTSRWIDKGVESDAESAALECARTDIADVDCAEVGPSCAADSIRKPR